MSEVKTYWEILSRRDDGYGGHTEWSNEGVEASQGANEFETDDAAWSAVDSLRELGAEWAEAEYDVRRVFGEPDFDDVAEGLAPGIYSAKCLNPPSGPDCTHLVVRDDGTLGWCDAWGDQSDDSRGQVSRFTVEDLCEKDDEDDQERTPPDRPIGDVAWNDDPVASYVACCYGDDGTAPGDCYTRIGQDEAGWWWVDDGDDAERGSDQGPYPTEPAARQAAIDLAEEQDEAQAGEDAGSMARRLLEERAGDPDPNGSYCVYWETALDDSGPRERYADQDAATAAAELANLDLHDANPGTELLCGFVVRELVDGEWSEIE